MEYPENKPQETKVMTTKECIAEARKIASEAAKNSRMLRRFEVEVLGYQSESAKRKQG